MLDKVLMIPSKGSAIYDRGMTIPYEGIKMPHGGILYSLVGKWLDRVGKSNGGLRG